MQNRGNMKSYIVTINKIVSTPSAKLIVQNVFKENKKKRRVVVIITISNDLDSEQKKAIKSVLIGYKSNCVYPVKPIFVTNEKELQSKKKQFNRLNCIYTFGKKDNNKALVMDDSRYDRGSEPYDDKVSVPLYKQSLTMGVCTPETRSEDRGRKLNCEILAPISELKTMLESKEHLFFDLCTQAGDDVCDIADVVKYDSKDYIMKWYQVVHTCLSNTHILNSQMVCLIMSFVLPFGAEDILEQKNHPQRNNFNIFRSQAACDGSKAYKDCLKSWCFVVKLCLVDTEILNSEITSLILAFALPDDTEDGLNEINHLINEALNTHDSKALSNVHEILGPAREVNHDSSNDKKDIEINVNDNFNFFKPAPKKENNQLLNLSNKKWLISVGLFAVGMAGIFIHRNSNDLRPKK